MYRLTIPEQLRATAQRLHKRNGGFICHELSIIATNDAGQTVYCPIFDEALNFSALRFLHDLGMPLNGGGFHSRSQHGQDAEIQNNKDEVPQHKRAEIRATWCEFAACLAEEWGITTSYPPSPDGNTFQAVPPIDRAAIEVTR